MLQTSAERQIPLPSATETLQRTPYLLALKSKTPSRRTMTIPALSPQVLERLEGQLEARRAIQAGHVGGKSQADFIVYLDELVRRVLTVLPI